jgi:FkbM family methyltransferase
MKNVTVIKDEKWVWPNSSRGEESWILQNQTLSMIDDILPHVRNRSVAIQAGGNCGLITNTFIPHFDHIYTFEPDPLNFYCLSQNLDTEKVTKMQCCLGETNTASVNLVNHPTDIGGNYVKESFGFSPVIAIDNLFLNDCGLIQLDVEGYELKVLKGAEETIKKYKPTICVEKSDAWMARYGYSFFDVVNFLNSLGYVYIKTIQTLTTDIVFVHSDFVK